MKKISLRFLCTIPVLALSALAISGCSPTGTATTAGENDVLRAIDPNADIAVYANLKKMNEAAISRKLNNMQDQIQQTAGAMDLVEKLKKITGLDDDNFIHMAFSLSNAQAIQLQPENVGFCIAVYVNKPVTADQIAEAIHTIVSEEDPDAEPLNVVSGERADFIELIPTDNAPVMKIGVMTSSGSTTVFFGDEESIEESVARSIADIPSRLLDPSAGLIAGEQGWISIIVPDSFKDELTAAAQQGAMMLGQGVMALETLQSIGVAARASDQLDIAIGLNLGDSDSASQIQSVLENSVISTARMLLAGQTSQPLPLLQSLTATQSGNRATLSLSLTLKDFEILQSTFTPTY